MKYNDLRKMISGAVFSLQDVRLAGGKIFPYQLSFWQKQGLIFKLRNGLYAFEDRARNISPEEIAGRLYAPSYISLEKALSAYGLIPEMTYAITSVTPKTNRTFRNRLGVFIYRHLKPSLFTGYQEIIKGEQRYLIAEPEKALLDFLYLKLKKNKSLKDIRDFRLNRRIIRELSPDKIRNLLKLFKNDRLKKIIGPFLKKK